MDVTAEADGRDIAKEGPIGTGPYVVSSFTKSVQNSNVTIITGMVR